MTVPSAVTAMIPVGLTVTRAFPNTRAGSKIFEIRTYYGVVLTLCL